MHRCRCAALRFLFRCVVGREDAGAATQSRCSGAVLTHHAPGTTAPVGVPRYRRRFAVTATASPELWARPRSEASALTVQQQQLARRPAPAMPGELDELRQSLAARLSSAMDPESATASEGTTCATPQEDRCLTCGEARLCLRLPLRLHLRPLLSAILPRIPVQAIIHRRDGDRSRTTCPNLLCGSACVLRQRQMQMPSPHSRASCIAAYWGMAALKKACALSWPTSWPVPPSFPLNW